MVRQVGVGSGDESPCLALIHSKEGRVDLRSCTRMLAILWPGFLDAEQHVATLLVSTTAVVLHCHSHSNLNTLRRRDCDRSDKRQIVTAH